MSSPDKEMEEATSTNDIIPANGEAESVVSGSSADDAPATGAAPGPVGPSGVASGDATVSSSVRQAAKRRISETVIEILDSDSEGSSVCAVDSYQASAAEVKRIRGDSTYSSSSDYSSDEDSPYEDDSVILPFSRSSCSALSRRDAELNVRAGRTDDPRLNPCFNAPGLQENFLKHWTAHEDLKADNVTLTCDPFRLCLLHNFLENGELINNIVDEMNTLDWSRKKMDLYEFHQTTDLTGLSWQRNIRAIYQLLNNEVMTWVSSMTGVRLTRVSASCSLYGPGDHLLVHDDLLVDRKVAFILYLAPWTLRLPQHTVHNGVSDGQADNTADTQQSGWHESMGGALELFAHDEKNAPTECVKRVLPCNNMLAFFRVGSHSYHQVAEVLSMEWPRLSINGWFHGPDDADDASLEEPEWLVPEGVRPHTEVVLMAQWLEPTYMAPRSRLQIQSQMEKASEVSLCNFLQPEKYQEAITALTAPDVPWKKCGPANQRSYEVVPDEWAESLDKTHAIRGLLKLLSGAGFFRFLTECTDLHLVTFSQLELQRWSASGFTVLPPKELYGHNQLDAILYLGLPAHLISGGSTTYVAPDDATADPLITLEPRSNALNLVYSDAGTARFTKYLSRLTMTPEEHFYILACSYRE